jgi:hypothetical protein
LNLLCHAPELRRTTNKKKKRKKINTGRGLPPAAHHRAGDALPRMSPGLYHIGAVLHCTWHAPTTSARVLAGRAWSSRARRGERGRRPPDPRCRTTGGGGERDTRRIRTPPLLEIPSEREAVEQTVGEGTPRRGGRIRAASRSLDRCRRTPWRRALWGVCSGGGRRGEACSVEIVR